ncbi:MarR family winged helix-turn-helix transcriptional regulator [Pararhodobacter sp. CCB-MM2]|uniref:MarR family winged helix-turn-helix transcriptional regulator n=1 Tax=Pararhodobacter sp. CCB-MM2 TaxID=1786003 RepID=UPI00082FEC56|nr:MarR family transcriptional regulator [Pararhodobacter sp. CCB-MM2]MCA2011635.1 MarR family transcriptional regulator [Cereibacter sphaeroides]
MTLFHTMPGHLIRRLNQIAVSIFQDRMQALGLDLTPVQFAALVSLRDNPGIDQATLAGFIAHDRVTIGGVVDRLQAKALVARTVNENDRRSRSLVLTAAGAEMLDRVLPEVTALQDEILCGLAPEERDAFVALASKATEAANDRSRAPLRVKD